MFDYYCPPVPSTLLTHSFYLKKAFWLYLRFQHITQKWENEKTHAHLLQTMLRLCIDLPFVHYWYEYQRYTFLIFIFGKTSNLILYVIRNLSKFLLYENTLAIGIDYPSVSSSVSFKCGILSEISHFHFSYSRMKLGRRIVLKNMWYVPLARIYFER